MGDVMATTADGTKERDELEAALSEMVIRRIQTGEWDVLGIGRAVPRDLAVFNATADDVLIVARRVSR